MLKEGLATSNTLIVASRLLHNGLISYEEATKEDALKGFLIAYDDMEINI